MSAQSADERLAQVGVPIKLMHEAEGHVITLETDDKTVFRGKLAAAEDNMNCQMSNVDVAFRDGHTTHMHDVFIRGSKIRFLIFPEMLANAPMFARMEMLAHGGGMGGPRGRGAPRGRGGGRGRGRGGFGGRGRGPPRGRGGRGY